MQTLTIILRFRLMVLWAVGLLFLILIICAISAAPQEQWVFGAAGTWNDARLAPVAAWLRGYPLYTPVSSGIVNGNIYPPLGALAFTPAAIFDHPVAAIIVGSILSLLMNLGPAVAALTLWSHRLQRSTKSAETILLGTVLYLGLLILTDGTRYTLFAIHVDAPAIALMLWGVIFYAKWWTTRAPSSIGLSTFFLGSGVWAKQVEFPLPFVFLIVTYLIGGLRPTLVFSVWSLATLVFWFLMLTPIVVDWRILFFNIWTIPASHPWVWGGQVVSGGIEHIKLFMHASVAFLEQYWLLYLLMLAMVLALNVCAKQSGDKSLHFSFALSACSLIASITMLPFALLGVVKVGGGANVTSHALQPVFFGLVIASLGFVEIAKKVGGQWNVVAQSVLCVGLVLIAVPSGQQVLHWRFDIFSAPMLTAYKESKSDNVWYPEFPLSSLLATGHFYHFSYAVFDRYLAGRPVSRAQILEGIPTPPFKLKYLEASNSHTNAFLIPQYLGLSDDTISHGKKTGPWVEIIVQDLPLLK
jgi:hypothetical protein